MVEQADLWGSVAQLPTWAQAPATKTEMATEPLTLWEQRAAKSTTRKRSAKHGGPNGVMLAMYGAGPAGATCGGCAHLVRVRYHDYAYFKCRKHGMTRGSGTDHRLKWPACRLFEPSDATTKELR